MENKKIKIAFIIPTLDPGGAERFFVDLIKYLDKSLFEPRLILYKDGGEWIKEIHSLNIKVDILKKRSKIDFKNFVDLRNNLKSDKPDIVHTQLGGDVYGVLAAKLSGVRKIITTEVNINLKESFLYNLIKSFSLKFTTKIVAVSKAVRSDAIKRYSIRRNKIVVIYNGIDFSRFSVIDKDKNNDLVFGTVGRLEKQKGQRYLIKAFSKVKDNRTKLLIAGQGFLDSELKHLVSRLNLEDRVKFLARVDTPEFLRTIDVFVLPSLWEGMGIVLVEAALSKTPIIASNIGGINEVVSNENAWMVAPRDVKAIKNAMNYFIDNNNSEEIKKKVDLAYKNVLEKFGIEKIVLEYQNLYRL